MNNLETNGLKGLTGVVQSAHFGDAITNLTRQ